MPLHLPVVDKLLLKSDKKRIREIVLPQLLKKIQETFILICFQLKAIMPLFFFLHQKTKILCVIVYRWKKKYAKGIFHLFQYSIYTK